MSTKTTIKRIALVAVSALGMGLLSVAPASALTVGTVATATLSTTNSQDNTVVVVAAGSAATNQPFYNIFTNNGSVDGRDITIAITGTNSGTPANGDTYNSTITTSTGAASFTVGLTKGQTAGTTSGTFSSITLDGLTAGGLSAATGLTASGGHVTIAASGSGAVYYIILSPDAAGSAFTTGTDVRIKLTVYQSSAIASTATLGTSTTTLAGRVGQEVTITPTAAPAANMIAAGSANFAQFSVATSITNQPAPGAGQSLVYPTLNAVTTAMTGLGYTFANSTLTAGSIAASTSTSSTGNSTTVAAINYTTKSATGISASTTQSAIGTITFTPVAAGTYTLVVWNETSTSGTPSLSGSESSQTFTINVATSVSTITMTALNAISVKSGSNGALVKLQLKDAAGNAATLAPGESVTVTPSGSAVINKVNGGSATGATAGQAWNLSASNFNSSGIAWINVTDGTAESSTITASIAGGASASLSLTFLTAEATTAAPGVVGTSTGVSSSSTGAAAVTGGATGTVPLGATSKSWRAAVVSGSNVIFTVHDPATGGVGAITGYDQALYFDIAAAAGTTYASSGAISANSSTAGVLYYIYSTNVTNSKTTVSSAAQAKGVLSVTPANVNAVVGSTNSFIVNLKDNFNSNYAGQTVTMSVAGKNPTLINVIGTTDTAGNATFSLTDANTNAAVTDTLTFSSGSSVTATVSYGTNAVSTVKVASDDYTVAGTANDTVSPQAIATGYAGAQGGARTVTATVKNAAGALLAGVPVVFTVSGTGAAILSTKKTVYTGVDGTASSSVYAWITGTYTVTATAGGVAGTATETFYSTGNGSVRTVSASANGNQVTGKATDRYGNPVQSATLYAKITSGSGNIGGALTATGTTDSKGEVVWVVSDANSTVTVSNIPFTAVVGTIVGQTSAAKGYDIGGADATAFTATTVGTTTTAETGVGASYDAAGVSSATADAVVTANSDAIDAANEATDAANAATDAANAAAEAADAATAAAQDAQAAVAELATQVAALIASIKSQLTSLTNLVIKIQKKVKA